MPCRLVVILALSHAIAISIFLRGFLLNRIELSNKSNCIDPELSVSSDIRFVSSVSGCWSEYAFDRAVIIIIDALRYDFVFGAGDRQGRMPKLTGLLADAGAAGVAVKFVADTPTITMSRLKAILTGNLPTFLDIGQSFSAAAIHEDNLLGQMNAQGMRVVAMGDDTWTQLAPPGHFAASYPYPAFDVRDLNTVDDGVWQHLLPCLRGPPRDLDFGSGNSSAAAAASTSDCGGDSCEQAGPAHASDSYASGDDGKDDPLQAQAECKAGAKVQSLSEISLGGPPSCGQAVAEEPTHQEIGSECPQPWDVLVAHYLGVDHAGHTYGGNSPEMYDKLRQIDEQVATVAEILLSGADDADAAGPRGPYSRTLLLVLGDHGQTMSGDHGGASREERDSALLAFNIGRWQRARQRPPEAGAPAAAATARDAAAKPGGSPGDGTGTNSPEGIREDAHYDTTEAPEAGLPSAFIATEQQGMPQIDLTPTLALLLGMPIPYGNLGRINRRLWDMAYWEGDNIRIASNEVGAVCAADVKPTIPPSGPTTTATAAAISRTSSIKYGVGVGRSLRESYLVALRTNAVQVGRYLTSYAAKGGLPSKELAHCNQLLRAAHEGFDRLRQVGGDSTSCSCGNSSSNSGCAGDDSAVGQDGCLSLSLRVQGRGPEDIHVASMYEAFLEAAGALARRKFTRFDLPAMLVGCLLAVGCMALHGWLFARLSRWSDMSNPINYGAAAAGLVHALGLFSVNWIQGEGRIICYSLEAVAFLLWLLAATSKASRGQAGSDSAGDAAAVAVNSAECTNGSGHVDQLGRCGVHGCSAAAHEADSKCHSSSCMADCKEVHVCGTATTNRGLNERQVATGWQDPPALIQRYQHSQYKRPGQLQSQGQGAQRRRRTLQRLGASSRRGLRRQAQLAGMLVLALACNVALQHYTLIDRWGSDPHDKRHLASAGLARAAVAAPQATTDGFAAAPADSAGGSKTGASNIMSACALLRGALETVMPLGLLPSLLEVIMRTGRGSSTAIAAVTAKSQRPRQQLLASWDQLQWRLLGVAPFRLVAAWWTLQLMGLADRSVLDVVGPFTEALVAPARALSAVLRPSLPAFLTLLLYRMSSLLLRVLRVAVSQPLATWLSERLVAPVLEVPLRLLLPRLVYCQCGLSVLQLLIRGAIHLIHMALKKPRARRQYQQAAAQEAEVLSSAFPGSSATTSSYAPGTFLRVLSPEGEIGDVGTSGMAAVAMLDAACTALSSIMAMVTLLSGPRGPAVMLLLWVHGLAVFGLLLAAGGQTHNSSSDTGNSSRHQKLQYKSSIMGSLSEWPGARLEPAAGALLAALGTQAFFLTGHFCEFSGLQYDSPFVGFDHMTWPATAVLFWLNTFGGLMLPALALPLATAALGAATGAASSPTAAAAAATADTPATASSRKPARPPVLPSVHEDNDHATVLHASKVHCNTMDAQAPIREGLASELLATGYRHSHLQPLLQQLQRPEAPLGALCGDSPLGADCHACTRASPLGSFKVPERPGVEVPLYGWLGGPKPGAVMLVALSCWRSLSLCTAVLSAALQRHNVVVWALFAPKLVFEVCFTAATYAAIVLVAVTGWGNSP